MTVYTRSLMVFIATFAFLLAGVAGVNPVMPVKQAAAVGSYDNASIANIALTKVGQYGGQCKAFVNNMVSQASGGSQWPAPGYHGGFSAAGGVQVSSADAEKGDIIQITPAGSTDATAESMYNFSMPSKRLHTAIIVENNGGGSFDVVDSNWGFNEVVMQHDNFNPYTWAAGSDIRIWRMGTVSGSTKPGTDFNGNGQSDILWYGPGTDVDRMWYGSSVRSVQFNKDYDESVTVGGTYTPVTGDFDGDDYRDILWYGPGSANDEIWYGTGTAGEFDKNYEITIGGTYTPVVGDFTDNGQDDILWYGPGTANDEIWFGSSSRTAKFNKNYEITVNGTYTPVVGYFDDDTIADILWYGPGTANDEMWYGNGVPGHFDKGYEISIGGNYTPVVGNFNGNPVGQDDILWYGPGSANDEIWFGSSSRTAKFNMSYEITVGGTYVPVSGDFDGDGYGDILWYGPGTANDEIRYGTSTPASFNSSYDITVNGDHIPVT